MRERYQDRGQKPCVRYPVVPTMKMDSKTPHSESSDFEIHPLWRSSRCGVCFILSISLVLMYMSRVHVNHIQPRHTLNDSGLHSNVSCHVGTNWLDPDERHCPGGDPAFKLFGASHWLDAIFQLPAALLSWRYGGKRVLITSMSGSGILIVAHTMGRHLNSASLYLYIISVLLAICQSAIWPSVQTVLGRWSTPMEIGRSTSLTYSGWQMGILFATLLDYGSNISWFNVSISYIVGALCVVWSLVCLMCLHDTPSSHPGISRVEFDYINRCQKKGAGPARTLPWRSMVTSLPVWGVVVCYTCFNWMNYIYLLNLSALNSLQKEISASVHVGLALVLIVTGYVADTVVYSGRISRTSDRKLFNSIGVFSPSVMLLLIAFLPISPSPLTLSLLCVGAVTSGSIYTGGCVSNILDTVPQHPGIFLALLNTMAALPIAVISNLVGPTYIDDSEPGWRHIFIIAATVSIFGGLFFLIFASGKSQVMPSHQFRETELHHSAEVQTNVNLQEHQS